MANFLALVVASLLAWVTKDALSASLGRELSTIVALLVWLASFSLVRRVFLDLRP